MSAHMPFSIATYPDEGDIVVALDDRHCWPGPVEAEHVPEDLIECDVCGDLRDCVVVHLEACNLYICSDCLPEHVEELESLRYAEVV